MTARLSLLLLVTCACVHAAEPASDATQPYTNAFRALAAGEWGLAYAGLSHVLDTYPDTAYAGRARDHMLRLDRLGLSERRALDQSGRAETIGFGVIYGAWAGLATTLLVDEDDDEKSAAAGMMLGAPIALFSASALTRGRTITRGQASLIRLGGYFGTWQGVGLTLLGDGRRSDNATLTGALVGGLAGIGVASLVGAATEPTTGEAALTSYGALWGTWLSFAATQVMSVDNDDATLATTLAGGVAGLASMALIAPHTDIREGRANLINLGGIAGTIMAGGLLLITQPDSGEAALATLMAGG
ncbi:MAG: hypothetical protein ABGY41_10645, partial [Candidatus Poribacteria bacterium]